MADPEHLKILKKGMKAWNKWRIENPSLRPVLVRADLDGETLNYFDFSNAYLRDANLQNAELKGANFNNADLTDADLTYSNLVGASFIRSHLEWVMCWGCNMENADLTDAGCEAVNFTHANLRGANFTGTTLGNTIFGNTELKGAGGLDSCIHESPSIIDHQTLIVSGNLPLGFLRGCGLPNTLIEYIPSLLNDPLQFYSSFISYSSKDQKLVDRLHADLQNKGVRCWLATADLKVGDKIRKGIDEAIRFHDKLLLVLSKHSVESDWVEQEVETTLKRERDEKRLILFPIRLDNAVMKVESGWPALIRNTRNIGDFSRWKQHDSYQKALDRLLRDLKTDENP